MMTQTRLTDDLWTTTVTKRPAASTESTEDNECSEDHQQSKQALRKRAAAHASNVAAEHFPELPVEAISWETSTRMERSAGKALYNRESEEITIRLSWDAYEAYGWEKFARTVRHELIHAWQYHECGEANHGLTFRRWVEPLETDRHCEQYAEPNYWVVYEDCGRQDPRYRRSTVVKHPERYTCRYGGKLSIKTM